MPFDSQKKFHLSGQQARHADGMKGGSAPKAPAMKEPAAQEGEKPMAGGGESSTIHHHEDGTHSVEHSDGEKSGPHAHLHEAMAHVAKKHGEGMHHFAHHDGMGGGVKTHHTAHGEEPQAQDHEDVASAQDHMGQFLNGGDEGEGEPDGDEGAMPMEHAHGGGLGGFGG